MNLNPRIYCADGVSLSVQASKFAYCTPRSDRGPYTEVEVGYIQDEAGLPLTPPDTWKYYASGEFPSDVYGWVPLDLVAEFIDSHGGMREIPSWNKFLLNVESRLGDYK